MQWGYFFCKFVFKFNEHIYDVFNEAFSYWKISHFKNDNYLLQKYFGPSVIVAFKGLPWHLRLWIHVCSQNPLLSIFSCQTKSVSNTNCNIIETQFVANKIPNRYDSKEKQALHNYLLSRKIKLKRHKVFIISYEMCIF